MNTHEILQKIREMCPELMELSFGCEIKIDDCKATFVSRYWHTAGEEIEVGIFKPFFQSGDNFIKKDLKDLDFEIIGHPVHLEHLLRAIDMPGDERYETVTLKGSKLRIVSPNGKTETSIEEGVGINNEQWGTVTNYCWADVEIDLTQSVEENLNSNESLREFISDVLSK